MSWRVVRCVLEHHGGQLAGADLLVLVYVANHASEDDGGGAWPSQRTLAGETGLAYRTVRYVLARLVDLGALEVEQRPGRTHRFRVRMCAVCLPGPSRHEVPGGRHQMPGGEAPDATESLKEPVTESNAVGASPRANGAPRPRPAGSEPKQAKKERSAPGADWLARKVETIRREQGDRAAEAYLAKVNRTQAQAWAQTERARLHSGVTPEGYEGYVPGWAAAQWKAMHPTIPQQEGTA